MALTWMRLFASLKKEQQQAILHGSGRKEIEFKYLNDRGDIVLRKHPFEGILPNMDRRYHETESMAVREELSKYLASQCCPVCDGWLREEARHVFIHQTTIAQVVEMWIGDCLSVFPAAQPAGAKSADRGKNIKRNSGPTDVFSQRRTELSEFIQKRRNAVWW